MKIRDSWRVKISELDNGMQLYAQYDPGDTTWISGIGVKCGAIHKKGGLPHLNEHLLARECKKYSSYETDLMFEKYMGGPGGYINVRIDRASTFLGHDSLYERSAMLQSFDLLANLFKDRLITQAGLDSEKAAVHQEYYVYGKDNIPDEVDNLLHQTMYRVNPARNRIDCEPEILRKFTLDQVYRFIGRYCKPRNSFIIIFGPKVEEAKRIAAEYFNDWRPELILPKLKLDRSETFPVLSEPRLFEEPRRGISQTHLAIGFPTEPYMEADGEALQLLARIWAFRVRRRLRDENRQFDGGVYRALAETPSTFMHGMIDLWLASSNHQFVLDAENVVLEEARRLKSDLVDRGMFDDFVYNLDKKYRTVFRDSPERLAELVIQAVCNGDEELADLHSYLERLYKITPKRLRNAANKYFTDNYARVLVYPEERDRRIITVGVDPSIPVEK